MHSIRCERNACSAFEVHIPSGTAATEDRRITRRNCFAVPESRQPVIAVARIYMSQRTQGPSRALWVQRRLHVGVIVHHGQGRNRTSARSRPDSRNRAQTDQDFYENTPNQYVHAARATVDQLNAHLTLRCASGSVFHSGMFAAGSDDGRQREDIAGRGVKSAEYGADVR